MFAEYTAFCQKITTIAKCKITFATQVFFRFIREQSDVLKAGIRVND